jgi:phospholipid transport system substrate-binding protein
LQTGRRHLTYATNDTATDTDTRNTMLTRRRLLKTSVTALVAIAAVRAVPRAFAQGTDQAVAFIEQTAQELTAIVNGPDAIPQKQKALQGIIDKTVDVDGVGRFCLGRFWRVATPAQQQEYLDLFHRVLMINITGKVANYVGVKVAVGRAMPREGDVAVGSTVTRPGDEPTKVEWLVSSASGSPKIIDVIAEGTSLRLTQRSDYSSYLSHNNNNVQALIDALRQQATQQPS